MFLADVDIFPLRPLPLEQFKIELCKRTCIKMFKPWNQISYFKHGQNPNSNQPMIHTVHSILPSEGKLLILDK